MPGLCRFFLFRFPYLMYAQKAHPAALPGSSVGCAPAWTQIFRRLWIRSLGPAKQSSVETGHEFISRGILSLLLVQVGHLSVTGKRMCT